MSTMYGRLWGGNMIIICSTIFFSLAWLSLMGLIAYCFKKHMETPKADSLIDELDLLAEELKGGKKHE